MVEVDFTLTQAQFDEAEGQLFKTKAYSGMFNAALAAELQEVGLDLEFDEAAIERLMGMILVALSVQMFLEGIKRFLM